MWMIWLIFLFSDFFSLILVMWRLIPVGSCGTSLFSSIEEGTRSVKKILIFAYAIVHWGHSHLRFRASRFKQYSLTEQQQRPRDSYESDGNLAFTIPREYIVGDDVSSTFLFHGEQFHPSSQINRRSSHRFLFRWSRQSVVECIRSNLQTTGANYEISLFEIKDEYWWISQSSLRTNAVN